MKIQKGTRTIPQSHLHSRISYLYQAATYLAEVYKDHPTSQSRIDEMKDAETTETDSSERAQVNPKIEEGVELGIEIHAVETEKPSISEALGPSRRLLSHLRAVSLKSQIRLTPNMKHSICKKCDSLLIPGRTSTSRLENQSRGGRKPWADILVVTCNSCGLTRRHPIGAKRQCRRTERVDKTKPGSDGIDAVGKKDELS